MIDPTPPQPGNSVQNDTSDKEEAIRLFPLSRHRVIFFAVGIALIALISMVSITLFLSRGFESFSENAAKAFVPEEGKPHSTPDLSAPALTPPGM